jgi:hypothetical protein
MFQWYTELSSGEKRTFWGCFGGWAMDAMDVQMLPHSGADCRLGHYRNRRW